jgi:AcrR family transcriptional regulator
MLSRDFLFDARRRRFTDAVGRACHEFGSGALTTTVICRLARASRATLYELFTGVDECIDLAVRDAHDRLFASMAEDDPELPWLPRAAVALRSLFESIAADPLMAELYLVHSFAMPSSARGEGPWRGAAELERLLAGGRREARDQGREPPASAEEFWAQSTLSLASNAVLRGQTDALPERARPLALLIGGSFLGADQAARLPADT